MIITNNQINKRHLTALALRDNTLTCHLREVRETRQNSKECQPQLQMIRSQGKNCSQWSSIKTGLYPFSEEGIRLNEGYPPRTLKLTVLSGPTVKHNPLPQEQATHRGTDKNGWYTGEPRYCCTKKVPKRILKDFVALQKTDINCLVLYLCLSKGEKGL